MELDGKSLKNIIIIRLLPVTDSGKGLGGPEKLRENCLLYTRE